MIRPEEIPTLYQKLKSHIARDFRPTVTTIVGGSGGATSFSGLSGTIANSQAPQFLLRDGSRSLTGSLLVDAGVTIDGVDLSAHVLDANAHHARQHSITGGDHSITGAALSLVGATATNTLGLITPSAAPGTTESVLKATSGLLTLPQFAATTSMRAPLIDTASGNLQLSPAADVYISKNVGIGAATVETLLHVETTDTGTVNFLQLEGNRNAADTEVGILFKDRTAVAGGQQVARIFADRQGSTGNFDLVFHGGSQANAGLSTEIMRLKGVDDTVAVSAALTVGTTATITGVTSIASGSVGAPGLAFIGNTNTGIYRSGTNAYSLVAGGAAIVNVGATGAGVNAAYDSTAALKVQSIANDDITLFLKQKSGQTARMWRVEDSAGQELIVLDSQGNLQSGNPGFVSGLTGWQITPAGNAELNNAFIRGELHASIFVMDEFHASGGTLYIAPAGKLELDATVYTTTGVENILDIRTTSGTGSGTKIDIRTTSGTGSGTQITSRWVENYFEITDPPSGHAMIFSAGDTIRCKALGLSVGIDLWDVWGVVGRVEDMTSYYRYYYDRKSGGANGLVIPAGTAIINYGAPGDGRIYLTADQSYAPYMQVFLSGEEPWNGEITPTVRIGRLDGVGLPGVSGIEQHGIVLSSDLSNASAPYLVASNLQVFQYKIDSEWNNGNPTARITADGAMKLGTDVDSASTTGFDFNPTTGALTIGSASYPGSVNVYGRITVTGGSSGIASFSDANLDNITNGATYGRINNTIISGGNIRVGSGTKDSTLSGWHIDSTEIVGQATGVDQVVMDTNGRLIAGAGALQLDRTAFHVANSATSKGIQFYNTSTFTDANKAGRLWALNGTPLSMYLSAGRSTFDGDLTNVLGRITLAAYNGSGIVGASVLLAGGGTVEITGNTSVFGDVDMNNYDIVDPNNVLCVRTTAW